MDSEERTPRSSLRDLLHVVFKRKTLILVVLGLTLCIVTVGSFLVKPTYEASAQVLVKIGRENVYVPTLPTGGSSPVISFNQQEEQVNSEIEILKSQFLAENVVESLGPGVLYKDLDREPSRLLGGVFQTASASAGVRDLDPEPWGFLGRFFQTVNTGPSPFHRAVMKLQKDLTVEAVRKSNVINISFKHKDPQLAATTVDTLVKAYLNQHLEVHRSPLSDGFFQTQSQVLKRRLTSAEERLKAFKEEHNLTLLEEQRLLLLRGEADRRAALNLTLSQEAETEGRLRQLRDQWATTPKIISLDEEIDHNPHVINSLQARLVELELKEHELLTKYTDQSRLIQSVRDEIQTVRKRLAEQEAKRYGRSRTGVNPVAQALQQDYLRNEAEVRALRARKDTLMAQLADYQRKLEGINRVEMGLTRLQQEVEVERQSYRLYLAKLEESRISQAMDAEKISNVSLIGPARLPLKPVNPNIRLNMVLGLFLGGVGAFGLAFLSEYLDDSLERDEDVENHLHLPVLASIPKLKR